MGKRKVTSEDQDFSARIQSWMSTQDVNETELARRSGLDRGTLRRRLSCDSPWTAHEKQLVTSALSVPFGESAVTPIPLFRYKEVSTLKRIVDANTLIAESLVHVVATARRTLFDHGVDVTAEELVTGEPIPEPTYDLQIFSEQRPHNLSLTWGGYVAGNERQYVVAIDPPLEPGEEFRYKRTFRLQNYFPLTRGAVLKRSRDPRFHQRWQRYGSGYYGTCWDVRRPTDLLSVKIHFPLAHKPGRWNAHVVTCDAASGPAEEADDAETERCLREGCLRFSSDEHNAVHALELRVPAPVLDRTYVLLYEPGK